MPGIRKVITTSSTVSSALLLDKKLKSCFFLEYNEYYPPPGYDNDEGEDYGPGDRGLVGAVCVTNEATGLDAYAWVKTPGESDGRMFPAGTYHPCLLNHFNECSDTCPQYVPKVSGEFQRPEQCTCTS